MRRASNRNAVPLLALALVGGCNQLLGIEQGRLPDGGGAASGDAGATNAADGGDAGAPNAPDGGDAGASNATDAGVCVTALEGTYTETETLLDDPCGGTTASGSSTLQVEVTGANAILTIDGTRLDACPADVAGCDLHWECTNASSGVVISADLAFDATGFSGTLSESADGSCFVLFRSDGVRK